MFERGGPREKGKMVLKRKRKLRCVQEFPRILRTRNSAWLASTFILKADAAFTLNSFLPTEVSRTHDTVPYNPTHIIIMPGAPQGRQFNPYSENGGTILAIAGADFSVIAGDTRQSEGYSIQTRYAPKVFRL